MHQNWLLCLQQTRHSGEMSPSPNFRWQYAETKSVGNGYTTFRQSMKYGSESLFQQRFSITPRAPDDILKLVRCSRSSEINRKTYRCGCNNAILSAQCSVHVRVTEIVATKEQSRLIRQVTMTATNRCLSPEVGIHNAYIFPSAHMQWPIASIH